MDKSKNSGDYTEMALSDRVIRESAGCPEQQQVHDGAESERQCRVTSLPSAPQGPVLRRLVFMEEVSQTVSFS